MPSKHDLEKFNIIYLAVLCGQVSENPATDEKTAEKAWQLKREWIVLVAREPTPSHKEHREIESAKDELRKRMAEFLAVNL
jgi:hypothetical protein